MQKHNRSIRLALLLYALFILDFVKMMRMTTMRTRERKKMPRNAWLYLIDSLLSITINLIETIKTTSGEKHREHIKSTKVLHETSGIIRIAQHHLDCALERWKHTKRKWSRTKREIIWPICGRLAIHLLKCQNDTFWDGQGTDKCLFNYLCWKYKREYAR